MRATTGILALVGLVGCSPFPQVDVPLPANADALDYPALIPLDFAASDDEEFDPEATEAQLNARVAALRGRAEALRSRPIE